MQVSGPEKDAFGSSWTPCPILESRRTSEDVQGRNTAWGWGVFTAAGC